MTIFCIGNLSKCPVYSLDNVYMAVAKQALRILLYYALFVSDSQNKDKMITTNNNFDQYESGNPSSTLVMIPLFGAIELYQYGLCTNTTEGFVQGYFVFVLYRGHIYSYVL